jgi:membrane associated rhomboid family serine protease
MMTQISGAVVIFATTIATSLIALFGSPRLLERSLFRPYWLLPRRQYETLILSGLVHGDLFHLLFNMLTYYFFAFLLETRIGSVRFVMLYLSGLLFSLLVTWYRHRNNAEYSCLGASGAIEAVLFAAVIYFPNMRISLFFIPIGIPAPLFAVLYLAYTYYAARNQQSRIAHDAHLGGALTGLGFVALTDPARYGAFFDALF